MMLRRTPLKRTAFKRPPMPQLRRATVAGVAPVAPGRLVTMARISDVVLCVPKAPRDENPHLLAMARGRPCLFRWVTGCRGEDGSTTVAAHENTLAANKGRGLKAHDWRSAQGCYACHVAYDQGHQHSYDEKAEAFELAMHRQRRVWADIAGSPTAKAKDKAAARWALEHWEKFEQKQKEVAHV